MFEIVDRDEVLRIVKTYGPLQPLGIRKFLKKGDSMIIGAVLSSLVNSKLLAITNLKRGSSPFYYDPNKPYSLEKIASFLKEKDYNTYKLLKEKKIIIPEETDPLTRVSLSNIKDYAIKKSIIINNKKIDFFKYFLVKDEEAEEILRKKKLGEEKNYDELKRINNIIKETNKEEKEIKEIKVEEKENNKKNIIEKNLDLIDNKIKIEEKSIGKNNIEKNDIIKLDSFLKKEDKEIKKIEEENNLDKKNIAKKEIINKEEKIIEEYKEEDCKDEFFKRIKNFFEKKEIRILKKDIIRKNREIDLIIKIPTSIGDITFYCKAKNKKYNNDGDLASALLKAQEERKPAIYLTTGIVTKKAKKNPDIKVIEWESQ